MNGVNVLKSCATCKNLFRKCDGECETCGHAVGNGTLEERTSSARPYEAVLEQIRFGSAQCKCMVCYDEDSGQYRHWEENAEITSLLKGEEE